MFEEEPPKQAPGYQLGDNLDAMSVGDLNELLGDLRAEIARVELEIGRKKGDMSAAESLFKP